MSINISFLIITYRRVQDTKECVESILALDSFTKDRDEIIIFNNEVNNKELSKYYFGSNCVSVVDSKANLGVAGGRNKAVLIAKNDCLFFIDDDAVINSLSVKSYIDQIYQLYPDTGAIAVQSRNYFSGDLNQKEIPNYNNETMLCSHYIGVGHIISKSDFLEFGGYDDEFFYGMEEFDFSYYLLKKGKNIVYCPEIIVRHKKNPEGRISERQIHINQAKNKITIAAKHLHLYFYLSHVFLWFIKTVLNVGFTSDLLELFKVKYKGVLSIGFVRSLVLIKRIKFNPFY